MSAPSDRPRPTSSPARDCGSNPDVLPQLPFPKSSRLLHRTDFRRVYDQGIRYTSRMFAVFCLDCANVEGGVPRRVQGPRVGFTVPRALGKAVKRNRIRRRLREAVRLELVRIGSQWDVVFNPRRGVLDAPFAEVRNEVRKLMDRCKP